MNTFNNNILILHRHIYLPYPNWDVFLQLLHNGFSEARMMMFGFRIVFSVIIIYTIIKIGGNNYESRRI